MLNCPHCQKAFETPRGLNGHLSRVHRDLYSVEIKCRRCSEPLTDENWYPSKKKINFQVCNNCFQKSAAPSAKKRSVAKRAHIRLVDRAWKQKTLQKARELLGGVCQLCGVSEDLHFAHLKYLPSEKHRGSVRTARVVLKHPENFLLLCIDCHFHPEKYLKELIELRARQAEVSVKCA